VATTFVAVLLALLVTGTLSARLSDSDPRRAVPRIVVGGMFAMLLTYAVGFAIGSTF
jgi:VIT1/CCC1 family predicted Fe2+/Mn2+ transporter